MRKWFVQLPVIIALAIILGISMELLPAFATKPTEGGGTAAKGGTTALGFQPSQPAEQGDANFSGQIKGMSGNTWIVGNITITVVVSTEVKPNLAAAVVGAFVFGEGTKQPDGSILAREVVVVTADSEPEDVHFSGKIMSENGTQWVIGTLSVTVNVTTEIHPNAAAAVVGAFVTGEGIKQPDGSVLAREIEVRMSEPRPLEVHFSGPIVSKNGDQWMIGNISVTVNVTTEIHPSPAAAVVGAFVRGQGIKRPDGTIIAGEIEVVTAPGGTVDMHVEFRGPINSFGANVWVVDGKTISITAQTQIHGTPVIGALAEVEALKKADGSLVAVEIEVKAPQAEQERVEFKGVISAFGPTQWTVGGKIVVISPTTVISGTPQVGLIAEVKAISSGGTLIATYIKVEKPEAQETEFSGQVTAHNGNLWMIGGKVVSTSTSTLIDESRGRAKVGSQVSVSGILLADGSVQASRIRIER